MNNTQTGVTLIELVVTISILVILMTIVQPSYQSITTTSRIAAEDNGLLGDLQYARIEAIKEGLPVTVCVSSDGTTCSNVTAWNQGWIVFSDPNGNAVVDPGESVLRIQKQFTGTDTFQANNNLAAVTFNREGFAVGIANGTLITLHDASASNNWTRCMAVNLVGSVTIQKYGATSNGATCT